MQDLTISLIQTSLHWENPRANHLHFGQLLGSLDKPGDIIILPEMFNTGFTMDAENNAEKMDGISMQWMAEMAENNKCDICGSLIIKEKGSYFNRLIWMKPDGTYMHYDKKHLFRMGDEHLHYSSGNKKLFVEVKGWKVLPLICYDLRFPVWSKNRYHDGNYDFDLLIYIANWPSARTDAWTSLLQGRAIENLVYSAGVNRIGIDGRNYKYTGDSMVTAPTGKVILTIEPGTEKIKTVKLDAKALFDIRDKIGAGNDWDEFEIK